MWGWLWWRGDSVMDSSELKQDETVVPAGVREQWQRPTVKKTDAKDAENTGAFNPDIGIFS